MFIEDAVVLPSIGRSAGMRRNKKLQQVSIFSPSKVSSRLAALISRRPLLGEGLQMYDTARLHAAAADRALFAAAAAAPRSWTLSRFDLFVSSPAVLRPPF